MQSLKFIHNLIAFGLIGYASMLLSCDKKSPSSQETHSQWAIFDTSVVISRTVNELAGETPWLDWDLQNYYPNGAREVTGVLTNGDSASVLQIDFEDEYMAFGLFRKIKGPGLRDYYLKAHKNHLFLKNKKQINRISLVKDSIWRRGMISSFMFLSDSTDRIPKVFNSFPQKGRIPNSEFVVTANYLGISNIGAVIGVQYPCYFDTLTLFRSFWNQDQSSFKKAVHQFSEGKDLKFSKKANEFTGKTDFGVPIYLLGLETGLIGQIGCFEPVLAKNMVQKARDLNALFRQNP